MLATSLTRPLYSACTIYAEPRRKPPRSERTRSTRHSPLNFEGSPASKSIPVSDLCALCVSAFSSPDVDALDAASSISPLFATLTKNTPGVGYVLPSVSSLLSHGTASTEHAATPTPLSATLTKNLGSPPPCSVSSWNPGHGSRYTPFRARYAIVRWQRFSAPTPIPSLRRSKGKNGRAPRTRWTDSPGRRTRSR
jgi:hypothetical protein